MAATPTLTQDISSADRSIFVVTWVLTTANPTGIAFEFPEWADRSFQVGAAGDAFGTATCTIEGSQDGVTFSPMSNAAGATAATFTTAGLKQIIELPRYMRPNLTAVGVAASITCIMLARRANPNRT